MTLFFPTKLTKVSNRISVFKDNDEVTYLKDGEIFYIHKVNDIIAFRFITCLLFKLNLAKQTKISRVFGISRNSIIGWLKEYNKNGAKSFYKVRRSEKLYVLKKREIKRIQIMIDKGISIDDIIFLMDIDIDAINDAIWDGRLIEPEPKLILKNYYGKKGRKGQNNMIKELNTEKKNKPKKLYF